MNEGHVSGPIVTMGVHIAPPSAELCMKAAAPVVLVFRPDYLFINQECGALIVINIPHLYLATGPPAEALYMPSWETTRADPKIRVGFALSGGEAWLS